MLESSTIESMISSCLLYQTHNLLHRWKPGISARQILDRWTTPDKYPNLRCATPVDTYCAAARQSQRVPRRRRGAATLLPRHRCQHSPLPCTLRPRQVPGCRTSGVRTLRMALRTQAYRLSRPARSIAAVRGGGRYSVIRGRFPDSTPRDSIGGGVCVRVGRKNFVEEAIESFD